MCTSILARLYWPLPSHLPRDPPSQPPRLFLLHHALMATLPWWHSLLWLLSPGMTKDQALGSDPEALSSGKESMLWSCRMHRNLTWEKPQGSFQPAWFGELSTLLCCLRAWGSVVSRNWLKAEATGCKLLGGEFQMCNLAKLDYMFSSRYPTL